MGIKRAALLGLCVVLSACGKQTGALAPVFDLKQYGRSSGAATVAPGDTPAQIARRYDVTIDDVIAANGQGLQPGQRVNLPPPRLYRAREGDTAYSVARLFDLQPADVIAQNNLYAPYTLRAGQIIHLSPSQAPAVVQQAAMPQAASRQATAPLERIEATPLSSQTQQTPVQPQPIQNNVHAAAPARGLFASPAEGRVISSYGPKPDGKYNDGINIEAPAGSPVRAARDGTVVYSGGKVSGYGNMVLVRHDDGFFTVYSHLADTRVAKGASVARGQAIGTVGSSGGVSGPQLHFEIRKGTKSLDPKDYL